MEQRAWNFSAGPAAMPLEVLQHAAAEMTNWHGSGMGVMEMSHRGKEFISIYEQAEADLRELLAVPKQFKILFMQGGGIAENAIVPLNLSRAGRVDFVVSGSWSQKSHKEAAKYGNARVAASAQANAGAHRRQDNPPVLLIIHANARDEIGAAFHARKAFENGVGIAQIVNQCEDLGCIGAEVEADRRTLYRGAVPQVDDQARSSLAPAPAVRTYLRRIYLDIVPVEPHRLEP